MVWGMGISLLLESMALGLIRLSGNHLSRGEEIPESGLLIDRQATNFTVSAHNV